MQDGSREKPKLGVGELLAPAMLAQRFTSTNTSVSHLSNMWRAANVMCIERVLYAAAATTAIPDRHRP